MRPHAQIAGGSSFPTHGSNPRPAAMRRLSWVAICITLVCISAAALYGTARFEQRTHGEIGSSSSKYAWRRSILRRLSAPARVLTPDGIVNETDRRDAYIHEQVTQTWGQMIKLNLIHRNSLESPFRQEFADRLEALQHAVDSDRRRIHVLVQNIRRQLTQSPHSRLDASSLPITGTLQASNSTGGFPTSPDAKLASVISGSSVGSGEYFVTLNVGTPPQKLLLIADTGSDITWMKCFPCNDCFRNNSFFEPQDSSSLIRVGCLSRECELLPVPSSCPRVSRICLFESSYTDSSASSGYMVFETITLKSSSGKDVPIRNLVLGCGRESSGPNIAKSGGVIGLGRGPLSFSSQIGRSVGLKFSYCLVDFFNSASVSSSIIFGNSTFESNLQYTPLLKNPFAESLYYVGVQDVSVGGVSLSIPDRVFGIDSEGNGGTIVDSGTTLAQFLQPAYLRILAAFDNAVTYPRGPSIQGLDLCCNVSGISKPKFPAFSITLQGNVVLNFPQDNYFTDAAEDIKCLAMQGVASSLGMSVIGNLLQQNFHIEFDRVGNRLGIAPADCSARS